MSRTSVFRLLAGCLCAGWCLLFLRCETTEKTMVRALYAADAGQGVEVVLLYQAPQAQADAAEVTAELEMADAEGENLEKALAQAEKKLPQTADYRLCDYFIVPEDAPAALLEQYEKLVLTRRCGRAAAKVCCAEWDAEQLLELQETENTAPDQLLEQLKQRSKQMPRLYQNREAMLLPLLRGETSGEITWAEEAALFTPSVRQVLDAEQARMAWLVMETPGRKTFWLAGQQVKIRRCSVSVSTEDGGAALRLDCQLEAGEPAPTPEQKAALEALAEQTVRAFWQQGVDLLALQQRLQLQGKEPLKTENACPELRTDVRFLSL